MKFRHAVNAVSEYDKTQLVYTDIEVTLTVEDIASVIKQLDKDNKIQLRDLIARQILNREYGSNESITLIKHGEMAVDMDYLVENMEFDAYLYAHHQEMRHVILSKPNYLAAELDFMDGILALQEKIKKEHHEDILDGNI